MAEVNRALGTTLQGFHLAESINLPVMVVLDAFFLSHTYEPVDVPDQADVDRFLPALKPRIRLDTRTPFGGLLKRKIGQTADLTPG